MKQLTLTKNVITAIGSSNRNIGILCILIAGTLKLSGIEIAPDEIQKYIEIMIAGSGAIVSIWGVIKDIRRKLSVKTTIAEIEPK